MQEKSGLYYLALANEIKSQRSKSSKAGNKKLKDFANYSTITVVGLTLSVITLMTLLRNK